MPTCSITMDLIGKIATVLACLFLMAVAIFTLIKLGGFHLSTIIFSVYEM